MKKLFALSVVAFVALQAFAQDTVRFSEGLMTSSVFTPMIRSPFTSDPVVWAFISGTMPRPVEGAVSYTPPPAGPEEEKPQAPPPPPSTDKSKPPMPPVEPQGPSKWIKVLPDSNGYFTCDEMRSGGLYLEYDSPREQEMLLETWGNVLSIVNGEPLEGDLYNWGYSIHPIRMQKGLNAIYLSKGRFEGIKAMLIVPKQPVLLTLKDLTLPDLIEEEQVRRYGAVQVINASLKDIKGYFLRCVLNGKTETTPLPVLLKENTRKLAFLIPEQGQVNGKEVPAQLILLSPSGKEIDRIELAFKNKTFNEVHDRTFISSIDGSVQYFSVTSCGNREPNKALFLSVHGAGVEARGQARAYKPKDWGNLVAATNRRPYGFNWEDWGRIDAMEVLAESEKLFHPDSSRIYLTGHSMGGHGTWHLGVTYPSLFAAIAPSAGYADLLNYGFRFGPGSKTPAGEMMLRGNNTSRTLTLARNYLHYGVYVFHGDADETVPVEQARAMRKLLGTFHPDFAYYEYPGGHHWISNESVDWPPIFEFFHRHTIPADKSVLKLEFYTANPGVSATSHWLTITQQEKPLMVSSVVVSIDTAARTITATTDNVALASFDTKKMDVTLPVKVVIDSTVVSVDKADANGLIWLQHNDKTWLLGHAPATRMKNPLRNGPFKDAFRNRMVFVYGTGGTAAENRGMYIKARFDASTFGYRGNGSIEIIPDKVFDPAVYNGRNVILYGNSNTNTAWKKVLTNCPVEAGNGYIQVGGKRFAGSDLSCFFIYPRSGNDTASVGVVASTGIDGIKNTYTNQYLNSGSGFPDLTVTGSDVATKGFDAILCTGFFGNDWSVEHGDFYWK